MPIVCSMGTILECNCAVMKNAPLNITPESGLMSMTGPVATITAIKPMANISFGLCKSPTNPLILASAGILTVTPCIPIPVGPWLIGAPKVITKAGPALTKDSKLVCLNGGKVTVTFPGVPTIMSS